MKPPTYTGPDRQFRDAHGNVRALRLATRKQRRSLAGILRDFRATVFNRRQTT